MRLWQIASSLLIFTTISAHSENQRNLYNNYYDNVLFTKELKEEWRKLGAEKAEEYREAGYNPNTRTVDYEAGGNYLNYGKTVFHREIEGRSRFDDSGLPMIFQGGEFQYNSVTVGNFALAAHGRYLDGEEAARQPFLLAAFKLAEMQQEDGSIPNNYPYRHYTQTRQYKPGWTDGMGPGIALSVYARAYKLTGDDIWREHADVAASFLSVPAPHGPLETLEDIDPRLPGYTYFSEYPVSPHVYTLNGHMFTLLGLYDWWKIGNSEKAEQLFDLGIKALEVTLPYFDTGTFSTYDLSYITHSRLPYLVPQKPHMNAGYHFAHIYQLRALYSVTGSTVLKEYADRWNSYVTD